MEIRLDDVDMIYLMFSRRSLDYLGRVVEFKINLVPDTTPISKVRYQISPKLLDEIKKQLTVVWE